MTMAPNVLPCQSKWTARAAFTGGHDASVTNSSPATESAGHRAASPPQCAATSTRLVRSHA